MPAPAALLGRDSDLAILTGLLEEARAGDRRVALICGDPGIGKTTLVEALESVAAEIGVPTVWGRCWEGGGGTSFWPWVQVFRTCLRDYGEHIVGSASAEFGRLLPELKQPTHPAPNSDATVERASLFLAVADLLEAAAEGGLVIALDDLHDADEGSLQLLRYVARRAARSRLLLVGTFRDTEVAQRPAHRLALGAVARHGPTIRLRGLSAADIDVLLERAGAGVAPAQLAEVHRLTDGNPFLVYEASRLLGASRANPDTSLGLLDQSGSSLVHARLDPLGSELRNVLGAAAVLGREFGLGLLSRICDDTRDDLFDLLTQARDLHVLDEVALARWSFSHALLREELLQQLDPDQRARLHRRAAEALVSGSGDDESASVAAIAHHHVEGHDPLALASCIHAARSATHRLAFEDAAAWYDRALALPSAATAPGDTRYELLIALGEALLRAGDISRAVDAHVRAIKAAQALGSVELAAEAAVRIARLSSTDTTVIGALDDALCDLPEADSSLRARVLVSFALALRSSTVDGSIGRGIGRQGLEMARRVGDRETLWVVLTQWHEVDAVGGLWNEQMRAEHLLIAEELIKLAEDSGEPVRVIEARWARALDLFWNCQAELAKAELQECLRSSRTLHQPLLERRALVLLINVHCFLGEFDTAEELVARLRDTAGADEVSSEVDPFLGLIRVRRHQGRFEEVERLASDGMERWTLTGLDCKFQIPGFLALGELGRSAEARALLDHFAGERPVEEAFGLTADVHGWTSKLRLCCPCALLEACCLMGDTARVEALHALLLPYAEDYSTGYGVCARYLALAEHALGRYEQADAHFQQAHAVSERLGARLWAAQGRLDHGRMLVERGDPDDHARAEELLAAARETFEAMALDVYERRAADLLRRVRPSASHAIDCARIVHEGEDWVFHYQGAVARLRDSKGLQYLARLLRNPGQEIHAVDLAAVSDSERARQSVTRAIKGTIERVDAAHPSLGEHLRSTVRIGVLSAYIPDQRAPIIWVT